MIWAIRSLLSVGAFDDADGRALRFVQALIENASDKHHAME
jgi:hypothetical protein